MEGTIAHASVFLIAAIPLLARQTDTLKLKEPELPKGATELTTISLSLQL
jgi:hypothetical protein